MKSFEKRFLIKSREAALKKNLKKGKKIKLEKEKMTVLSDNDKKLQNKKE